MRSASKERAKELRAYGKRVKVWLREHPHCRACLTLAEQAGLAIRVIRLASECHHMRGRNGDLLLDESWWLPVCRTCHDWITTHGKLARELGLIVDINYREDSH
jgi:hypothetical protein